MLVCNLSSVGKFFSSYMDKAARKIIEKSSKVTHCFTVTFFVLAGISKLLTYFIASGVLNDVKYFSGKAQFYSVLKLSKRHNI